MAIAVDDQPTIDVGVQVRSSTTMVPNGLVS
jgi:hypothetical protein